MSVTYQYYKAACEIDRMNLNYQCFSFHGVQENYPG